MSSDKASQATAHTGIRVDNVPLLLKLFFWIYGYGGGLLFFLFVLGLRLTLKVSRQGEEFLQAHRNYIFAMWHHENFPSFVALFYRIRPMAILNHPAWYMKHIHVLLYFLGIKKLILGSTGHGGRQAADKVVEELRKGYSTFINPDGPYGPALEVKKGVLHMALQSGVSIVAVRFVCSREYVAKSTWEGKRCPLPFSRMTLIFSRPIAVTEENFSTVSSELRSALDGKST